MARHSLMGLLARTLSGGCRQAESSLGAERSRKRERKGPLLPAGSLADTGVRLAAGEPERVAAAAGER